MQAPSLVVDLCGTLVGDNTTHEFLRRVPMKGRAALARGLLLSRAGFFGAHLVPAFAHRERAIACLAGHRAQELEPIANDYAGEALQRAGRPGILARVAAQPATTYIASASLDVVVAAFARALGVAGWIACELEYDAQGVCTGRIRADSQGRKLQRLEARFGGPVTGFDLITDNPEDTDLMRAARHVDFIEQPR